MNDGELAIAVYADLTGSSTHAGSETFRLVGALPRIEPIAYSAVTSTGRHAVLIPLVGAVRASARLTTGLSFAAVAAVDFRFGGRSWRTAAAVLEAEDPRLLRTFSLLAASIIGSLLDATPVTWARVTKAFDRWDALLRRRAILDAETELGLWGELSIIAASSRIDDLVLAWTGPAAGVVDFFLTGSSFEVKTTRKPGVFFVSHDQVEIEALDATFVAVDVAPDPIDGRSLVELADAISRRCEAPIEFEEKLLAVGFSASDSAAYTKRFAWLDRPKYYPRGAVPRVRAVDAGVSRLRYRVELDASRALSGELEARAADVLGLSS